MGIHGIGTAGCLMEEYMAKKAERNPLAANKGFMEILSEKAADPEEGYDEKAFESVGANAPEVVKQAWMAAAKETGVNGIGMSGNGKLTHLTQMMAQRMENWVNGIGGTNDLLGSTVQSAIRATKQALYDIDHPYFHVHSKSIEIQRQQVKEREFYQSFLDKLCALREEKLL